MSPSAFTQAPVEYGITMRLGDALVPLLFHVSGDRDADTFTASVVDSSGAEVVAMTATDGAYVGEGDYTPVTVTLPVADQDDLVPGSHRWVLRDATLALTLVAGPFQVLA